MKVPTIKPPVAEKLCTGSVETSNGAILTIHSVQEDRAVVGISNSLGSTAYFTTNAAREAANFFNNLANVLEGKPQE